MSASTGRDDLALRHRREPAADDPQKVEATRRSRVPSMIVDHDVASPRRSCRAKRRLRRATANEPYRGAAGLVALLPKMLRTTMSAHKSSSPVPWPRLVTPEGQILVDHCDRCDPVGFTRWAAVIQPETCDDHVGVADRAELLAATFSRMWSLAAGRSPADEYPITRATPPRTGPVAARDYRFTSGAVGGATATWT